MSPTLVSYFNSKRRQIYQLRGSLQKLLSVISFFCFLVFLSFFFGSKNVCGISQGGVIRAQLEELLANDADVHYVDSVASSEAIATVLSLFFSYSSMLGCFYATNPNEFQLSVGR